MTLSAEAVLTLILSLPTWHEDLALPLETRNDYLRPVAEAIAEVAKNRSEARALVTVALHESRFARAVIEGRCDEMPLGARCDNGRARGPWQVHRWCKAAWENQDGSLEALRGGARCALRYMRAGYRRCKSLNGAFAAGTGRAVCQTQQAVLRRETYEMIAASW